MEDKPLAKYILQERRKEIESEFYTEVTKKEFDYWFESHGGSKPKLDMAKHGGYVVREEGADETRYMMLKRSKYTGHTVGRVRPRFVPNRKSMSDSVRLANKLMNYGKQDAIKVYKNGKETKVSILYYSYPAEYKGTFVSMSGDTAEERRYEFKQGNIPYPDKMVIRAILRWANDNGLLVHVTSTYKGDGK